MLEGTLALIGGQAGPEAEEADQDIRVIPLADRRTTARGEGVPIAAANHAARARRSPSGIRRGRRGIIRAVIPVPAPLPHISRRSLASLIYS